MNVYQLISDNRELLVSFARAGINPSSIWQVDLFEDYQRLIDSGESSTISACKMADKYRVSIRTVWGIIKKMQTPI